MGLRHDDPSRKQKLAVLLSSTHFLFAVLIVMTMLMALLIRLMLTSFIF
jgi:hypothetical protein